MTWLALVAMLAFALLPSLSHALVFAGGDAALGAVCSADHPAGTPAAPDGPPSIHLEHCPLCSLQGQALGMPPAAAGALPPALPARERPLRFFQAPRTPFAWRPAQPRAPPSFS